MCSNCSGDDLRPESFTTFDVSSPNSTSSFAAGGAKNRKEYRTRGYLPKVINAALTLGTAKGRKSGEGREIIESVHRGGFVNLNLGKITSENGSTAASPATAAGPFEILVSPMAIVEIYAAPNLSTETRDDRSAIPISELSAWEESGNARAELRRTKERPLRASWAKRILGYAAFVVAAAFVLWCAIR